MAKEIVPELDFSSMVDSFIEGLAHVRRDIEQNKLIVARNEHLEFELSIFAVGVEPISRMMKSFKKPPLITVMGRKEVTRNNSKYRGTVVNGFLAIDKFVIGDNDMRWDRKKRLDNYTRFAGGYMVAASIEERVFAPLNRNTNTRMMFVISTEVVFENIKLTHRIKFTKVQSNNLLDTKSINPPYLEIEVIDVLKPIPSKDTILNLLGKVLGTRVGTISKNNRNPVSTFSVSHMYIFSKISNAMKSRTDSVWVANKMDGINIRFTLYPDGRIRYIMHDCIRDSKTNFSEGRTRIDGFGELFKKDDLIYMAPYHILAIEHNGEDVSSEDRLENIDLWNKFLVTEGTIATGINLLEKKLYGPLGSLEELLTCISNNYDSASPVDGMIVMNMEGDQTIDYKFKFDDTVDIMCVVNTKTRPAENTAKYMISFPTKYNFSNSSLDMDTLGAIAIIKDPHHILYDFCYVPFMFICEYSILSKRVVAIRMDKTNKLYNIRYVGNKQNVVEQVSKDYSIGNYVTMERIRNFLNKNESIQSILLKYQDSDLQFYYDYSNTQSITDALTNLLKTNILSNSLQSVAINKRIDDCLDIDSGRGGDLNKFYFIQVHKLVVTDPDKKAIAENRERYKSLSRKKENPMNYSSIIKSVTDPEYINDVRATKVSSFDSISWQMAMHFSWEPKHMKQLYQVFSQMSKRGTRFNTTIFKGERVDEVVGIGESRVFTRTNKMNDGSFQFKISNFKDHIEYIGDGVHTRSEWKIYEKDLVDFMSTLSFTLTNVSSIEKKDIFNSDGTPRTYASIIANIEIQSPANFFNGIIKSSFSEDDWLYLSMIHGYTFIQF